MPDNPFVRIPDIDFVPKSVEELMEAMVREYEEEYFRQTGKAKTLPPSSEERIFIYTQALRIHQVLQRIDFSAKQNLLKYSSGAYLDNLAAMLGLERLEAQASVTTVQFTLSAVRPDSIRIPKGTRVSTRAHIYFATDNELTLPAGTTEGTVTATSLEKGRETAGIGEGEISILVDPIPFVAGVSNTDVTQGGVDREDDESFRLRCYHYPKSYSVAGPEEAYEYYIASFSQAIEGISASSPLPGEVDVRITLQGGELPTQAFIQRLYNYLEPYRPMTDHLYISAPDIVEYSLDFTWYIARSRQLEEENIRKTVDQAVQEYLAWQSQKIGRDIIPDQLTRLAVAAGAKRLNFNAPEFTAIPATAIARNISVNAVFGGIEDD